MATQCAQHKAIACGVETVLAFLLVSVKAVICMLFSDSWGSLVTLMEQQLSFYGGALKLRYSSIP